MNDRLKDKTIAVLVADGFEQIEMTSPRDALEAEGADVHLISPSGDRVKGWQHTEWGDEFEVDKSPAEASVDDYDGLLLPGGVMSPDTLRIDDASVSLVRRFFEQGKPVAAICHGPWTLINAGVVKNRQLTSYPTIRVDLQNAGARWVDQEVVVDHGLVTSRSPDDLDAFNAKIVEEYAEGYHAAQEYQTAAH